MRAGLGGSGGCRPTWPQLAWAVPGGREAREPAVPQGPAGPGGACRWGRACGRCAWEIRRQRCRRGRWASVPLCPPAPTWVPTLPSLRGHLTAKRREKGWRQTSPLPHTGPLPCTCRQLQRGAGQVRRGPASASVKPCRARHPRPRHPPSHPRGLFPPGGLPQSLSLTPSLPAPALGLVGSLARCACLRGPRGGCTGLPPC